MIRNQASHTCYNCTQHHSKALFYVKSTTLILDCLLDLSGKCIFYSSSLFDSYLVLGQLNREDMDSIGITCTGKPVSISIEGHRIDVTVLVSSSNRLHLLSCFCAKNANIHAFLADSRNFVPFHEQYNELQIYL